GDRGPCLAEREGRVTEDGDAHGARTVVPPPARDAKDARRAAEREDPGGPAAGPEPEEHAGGPDVEPERPGHLEDHAALLAAHEGQGGVVVGPAARGGRGGAG